jgi:ASC-1-like (ASCH) protein
MQIGINPIPENWEQLQQERKQEQYNALIEQLGSEEAFNQASNNLVSGLQNYNNFQVYNEELRDELTQLSTESDQALQALLTEKYGPSYNWTYGGLDQTMRQMYAQNAARDLQYAQSNAVKSRLYDVYFPGIAPGDNVILDDMMSQLFAEQQASEVFKQQMQMQGIEISQEEAEATEAQRTGLDYLSDVLATYGPSLILLYGTGGQFTWQQQPTDVMDPEFGEDQSGVPSGWGDDYSQGPDYYYDPETGEIGVQDPTGGIPEDTEIPDFTRPDPVKEGIDDFGTIDLDDLSEYGGLGDAISFSEYSYSQKEQASIVESKLGTFETVTEFNQEVVDSQVSEASLVSDWVKNMPNMPKAARFLYPKS